MVQILANILFSSAGKGISIVILIFLLIAIISLIIKVSIFTMAATFVSGLFTLKKELAEVDYQASQTKGREAAKKVKEKVEQKKKNIDFTIDKYV